jgi:hypothetical protein
MGHYVCNLQDFRRNNSSRIITLPENTESRERDNTRGITPSKYQLNQ